MSEAPCPRRSWGQLQPLIRFIAAAVFGYSHRNAWANVHLFGQSDTVPRRSPKAYPYPADKGAYSIWYWMYVRFATDRVPGLGPCAVRVLDRLLLAGGTPAVYSYLFAHPAEAFAKLETGGAVRAWSPCRFTGIMGSSELSVCTLRRNPESGLKWR